MWHPDRRLGTLLTFADIVCAIRDDLARRLWGPRCGFCWQRTHRIVAHCVIDHADEI
jgi:hypothetical protein